MNYSTSKFWLPKYYKDFKVRPVVEQMSMLASIRRAVANFVKIVTNKDIPVVFSSGQQSYTDNKKIVLAASYDFEDTDSMVGLALHEASHIIYSQYLFDVLHVVTSSTGDFNFGYNQMLIDQVKIATNKKIFSRMDSPTRIFNDIKYMVNIIEDRRIDSKMYSELGGYRGYYDALYKKYWLSEEISNAFETKTYGEIDLTVPNFVSYLFHITNFINPNFDGDALPGLQEIVNLIDVDNVERFTEELSVSEHTRTSRINQFKSTPTLDNLPEIFKVAAKCVSIMYEHVLDEPEDKDSDESGQPESNCKNWKNTFGSGGLPNYDIGEGGTFKEQVDFINNNLKKNELTSQQYNYLKMLEDADAELRTATVESSIKTNVLVYKNVTMDVVNSPEFPFKAFGVVDRHIFPNGIQMGKMLSNKLRIIGEDSLTRFNRQDRGKIDKRRIAAAGMGEHDFFTRTTVDAYNPILCDISIDSSGSMRSGNKWVNTFTYAIAMAYVASINPKIRVRITARTSTGRDLNSTETPCIAVLHDSKYNSMKNLEAISRYICPTNATPEGLVFDAMMKEIINDETESTKYFINISDGVPVTHVKNSLNNSLITYSGAMAYQHTQKQIQKMKKEGLRVLSYFICDDVQDVDDSMAEVFKRMYGDSSVFIDVKSVNSIASTLNKLFLKK